MTEPDRRPRVSFVVPSYNYARYLPDAVDSLLTQTFQQMEVIVVDDASTDDTSCALERYRDDARVRVIRHDTNHGHIRSYNEGLAAARGEFLGLMSADDFCCRRDAVARQVEVFDRHPEVAMVYSGYAFANERGDIEWAKSPWPRDFVRDGIDEFGHLVFDNYIAASGPLVRRGCHEAVGYYDERLPHTGDWDLWLRIACHGSVGYIAQPLYVYRIHSINMHHRRVGTLQSTHEHVLTVRRAFETLPETAPPSVSALRKRAIRHAWLRTATVESSAGRKLRGWRALGEVARHAPSIALTPEFSVALAKALVRTTVGYRTTMKVRALWRQFLRKTPVGSHDAC
jgi:glycosyltransferase involved in cell wall biosynthesis